MGIEATITKQLDNKYVQVDITSKKQQPRYYKVPAEKADAFCADYKKKQKHNSIVSNVLFGLSITGGALIGNLYTSGLKKTFAKVMGNTFSALITSTLVMLNVGNIQYYKNQDMLKQYDAKEIHYEKIEA